MLVKYVKDKRGQRVGVVVAIAKDRIGWSKCNFSKGDQFNKEWGKMIAKRRAEKHVYTPEVVTSTSHIVSFWNCTESVSVEDNKDFCDAHNVAQCVRPDLLHMVDRASHYFKDQGES